jgi:hypothetical protein
MSRSRPFRPGRVRPGREMLRPRFHQSKTTVTAGKSEAALTARSGLAINLDLGLHLAGAEPQCGFR